MIDENLALQYHDRFTRGELLTAEEQAELDRWYAQQDEMEASFLNIAKAEPSMNKLSEQIERILIQIATVTKRIQDMIAENQSLRYEITALRQQFVQLSQVRQMSHDYA